MDRPNTNALPTQLYVKLNRKYYPVASLAEASEKYTGAIREVGAGISRIPSSYAAPLIIDDAGNIIDHIAYNGRIFRGTPQEQLYKTELPIYEARSDVPDFMQAEHDEKFIHGHPDHVMSIDPDFTSVQSTRTAPKRLAKYTVSCPARSRNGIDRVQNTTNTLTTPRNRR
jgi:hypothetical protein